MITEHWSFYHFRFYSTKELKRIKRIFHRSIPLIAVSRRLLLDIEEFSDEKQVAKVIPNAVDTGQFNFQDLPRKEHYLMVAFWKLPKAPELILEAIAQLKQEGTMIKLRIGGYGPLMKEIEASIDRLGIHEQVSLLGKLEPAAFRQELNECKAFLLPSGYETFSAVCAEALCCGAPIFVSDKGALPELVDSLNGRVVSGDDWAEVLKNNENWDHAQIAMNAGEKYDKATVGRSYAEYLQSLIHEAR